MLVVNRSVPLPWAVASSVLSFVAGLFVAWRADSRLVALSPDGQHRIDFVVTQAPFFGGIGGGSDVGGYLALVNRDTNRRVAKSGHVPLLSSVSFEQIRWAPDSVELTIPEADGLKTTRWSFR